MARFEDRRTAEAWSDAEPRFRTHVLGPHFEQLARDFTRSHASTSTMGAASVMVAPAVINDAEHRSQHEIDVVALARAEDGSNRVAALGEAKFSATPRTIADLKRLERIRTLVIAKHPSATDAKLLLFASSGFEPQLTQVAGSRDDVELIDMERLYFGE